MQIERVELTDRRQPLSMSTTMSQSVEKPLWMSTRATRELGVVQSTGD